MNRHLILAVAVLAIAGCRASNHGSVDIFELCFNPTPDATTGACSYSATCTATDALGAQFVDLALTRNTFLAPLQIDNLRTDPTDTTSGRTDTNIAFIERFDMRYELPGLTFTASSPQSGTIPSSGSTVIVAVVIPSAAGARIASSLGGTGPVDAIIHVKAHGRYGDDTEFDTAEFSLPVSISNGFVSPPTCTDTTKTFRGCPQPGQTATTACN